MTEFQVGDILKALPPDRNRSGFRVPRNAHWCDDSKWVSTSVRT